jgi:hypothetical protein
MQANQSPPPPPCPPAAACTVRVEDISRCRLRAPLLPAPPTSHAAPHPRHRQNPSPVRMFPSTAGCPHVPSTAPYAIKKVNLSCGWSLLPLLDGPSLQPPSLALSSPSSCPLPTTATAIAGKAKNKRADHPTKPLTREEVARCLRQPATLFGENERARTVRRSRSRGRRLPAAAPAGYSLWRGQARAGSKESLPRE